MSDKSKIEWTDATWNPIRGCSVVSEGCRNCYAMHVAARFSGKDQAYEGLAYRNDSGAHWTHEVRFIKEHLEDPLRWQRPRRIFVNSMSDLFHPGVADEWIDRIFAVMALAPQHTFQVLTKRPARMRDYFAKKHTRHIVAAQAAKITGRYDGALGTCDNSVCNAVYPYKNVWLGVSCEDQRTADERIPLLLETPAAVRWISAEPLLGPVDLSSGNMIGGAECFCGDFVVGDHGPLGCDACRVCRCKGVNRAWSRETNRRIDWVVVGGESGPKARPMHPDWARSLRDQCVVAGVPFFFKQWGEWLPSKYSEEVIDLLVADNRAGCFSPEGKFTTRLVNRRLQNMFRFGKKASGRRLDGREWNEYPSIAEASA